MKIVGGYSQFTGKTYTRYYVIHDSIVYLNEYDEFGYNKWSELKRYQKDNSNIEIPVTPEQIININGDAVKFPNDGYNGNLLKYCSSKFNKSLEIIFKEELKSIESYHNRKEIIDKVLNDDNRS